MNLRRGETVIYDLTVTDPNGGDVDLNDYSIWFTVKDDLSKTDAQAIVQKTKSNGINVSGSDTSTATVTLTAEDTLLFNERQRYHYDITLKKTSTGEVIKRLQGVLTFSQPVTLNT